MTIANQIIHGNALEVMAGVPGCTLDLLVTDPPYGVNYRDRTGRQVRNDDALEAVLPVFDDLYRALRPGGFCISFYGWNRVDRFMAAWKAAGFTVAGHIVWTKDYASRKRYLAYHHEQAYVLVKGQARLPAQPIPDLQPWTYSGNRAHGRVRQAGGESRCRLAAVGHAASASAMRDWLASAGASSSAMPSICM